MNTLVKIFSESTSGADFAQRYTTHISNLASNLDFKAIEKVMDILLKARADGKKIFFIGNGGSAATSSHFANDLALGTKADENIPFKVISLTDNCAILTALANDTDYDNVFVGQMKYLFEEGDILIGISASGNSQNVINGIEYANENGGISIGLIGFDGGKMKDICQHSVIVNTMKKEYGPVEDIHMILDHLISIFLRMKIGTEQDPDKYKIP
jgi:D-sedoheptulose 7-phosphate isomerase